MIDPLGIIMKTAINYVSFKAIKTGVDNVSAGDKDSYQYLRAAQCVFCLKIWSESPEVCPHCYCKVMKKLYKDYDFRRRDDEFLEVDNSLTMRSAIWLQ